MILGVNPKHDVQWHQHLGGIWETSGKHLAGWQLLGGIWLTLAGWLAGRLAGWLAGWLAAGWLAAGWPAAIWKEFDRKTIEFDRKTIELYQRDPN